MLIRILFLALVAVFSQQAHAGEGLFSRVYTVETVPEGHFELEQTVRNRVGRAYGDYNAFDLRSEFEYGITNEFQVAAYINTQYLRAHGASDDNDAEGDTPQGFYRDNFNLQSLSLEFIYRLTSPVTAPVGIALYFEPEWMLTDIHNGDKTYDSEENEFRVLFQKNFMDDTLIVAYNFVIETEYFRYSKLNADGSDTLWMGEFDWNNELGVTYRLANALYGGLEARNHNELGNFRSHDHSVYWVGPAFHYAGERFWATLGALVQVYGLPSGLDDAGTPQGIGSTFLHSHERLETTLKVAWSF